ncbi:MAG: hypothetical protein JSS63_15205 [Bacteroidetes bacterium]|nr:hypothetical protein [Bacteroidota bacterium]
MRKKRLSTIKKEIALANPKKIGWYAAIDKNTGNFRLGRTLVNSYKNAKAAIRVERFSFYKIGVDPISLTSVTKTHNNGVSISKR